MILLDCLSGEIKLIGSLDECTKLCESLGGKEKAYYVFTETEKRGILKEVETPKGDLTLFKT